MASSASRLSAIRAVLFDIDDTLFPSSAFSAKARQKAVSAMIRAGLQATPAKVRQALLRIIKTRGSNYGRHFDLLSRRFPCPERYRVVAAGVAAYHDTKIGIRPYPAARRILLALRRRRLRLAIASEGRAVKQWDKLIRLGLDPLFRHVFVTPSKSPSFYRQTARSLGLPPAAILMVGNHPSKDVAAARAAGLRAIRIRQGRHAKTPSVADAEIRRLDALPRLLFHRR